MKYICEECDIERDFSSTTSIVVKGEVVTKEAICPKCGKYMKYMREHEGLPTNIGKFNILTREEKKKKLKERSNEHFKKHIKEKKRELDTNHLKKL